MPIALGVVFLGGGAALAAPQIGEMIGSPAEIKNEVLLNVDVENFNFAPTVTAVEEGDDAFLVFYEITTLSPLSEGWEVVLKTGQFTVSKSSLDDTGLQGKVVAKLRDLENAEKTFLARAQVAERDSVATSRPANIFSSLIGRTPDDIYVPKRERLPGELPEHTFEPAPEVQEENSGTSTKLTESRLPSETASSAATSTDSMSTSSASIPPPFPSEILEPNDSDSSDEVGETEAETPIETPDNDPVDNGETPAETPADTPSEDPAPTTPTP